MPAAETVHPAAGLVRRLCRDHCLLRRYAACAAATSLRPLFAPALLDHLLHALVVLSMLLPQVFDLFCLLSEKLGHHQFVVIVPFVLRFEVCDAAACLRRLVPRLRIVRLVPRSLVPRRLLPRRLLPRRLLPATLTRKVLLVFPRRLPLPRRRCCSCRCCCSAAAAAATAACCCRRLAAAASAAAASSNLVQSTRRAADSVGKTQALRLAQD